MLSVPLLMHGDNSSIMKMMRYATPVNSATGISRAVPFHRSTDAEARAKKMHSSTVLAVCSPLGNSIDDLCALHVNASSVTVWNAAGDGAQSRCEESASCGGYEVRWMPRRRNTEV